MNKLNNKNKNSGFSLIEVMVALLVVSIGLLGYAGLQMNGLQQTQAALIRSQASIFTYDLADRMRANVPGVEAGGYKHQLASSTTPSCAAACTPYQLAVLDIKNWLATLKQRLPLGNGSISCADSDATDANPCSAGSIHTIRVSWDSNKDGIANASMEVKVQP